MCLALLAFAAPSFAAAQNHDNMTDIDDMQMQAVMGVQILMEAANCQETEQSTDCQTSCCSDHGCINDCAGTSSILNTSATNIFYKNLTPSIDWYCEQANSADPIADNPPPIA